MNRRMAHVNIVRPFTRPQIKITSNAEMVETPNMRAERLGINVKKSSPDGHRDTSTFERSRKVRKMGKRNKQNEQQKSFYVQQLHIDIEPKEPRPALRFPLLGPNRQETLLYFKEQERARLDEQLLGTPRPKRALELTGMNEVSPPLGTAISRPPGDVMDYIRMVSEANIDAFSKTSENVESNSQPGLLKLSNSITDLRNKIGTSKTKQVEQRRHSSITSLPDVTNGTGSTLSRQSSRLYSDFRRSRRPTLATVSHFGNSEVQTTLLPQLRYSYPELKPLKEYRREKTIVPSKHGYHPRSNSPTYKYLEKSREELEELIRKQLTTFTQTFSNVSSRHLPELCTAFEQSSYFTESNCQTSKGPLASKHSISLETDVPERRFLLDEFVYENHLTSAGLMVRSHSLTSSATSRTAISVHLPPIDGPLEEEEENDSPYTNNGYS